MSVPRSSWVQTRGMTILLLLFYQQKSFSSHKRRSNKNAYKHNRRHTYRHALTHSSDLTRLHLKWPNLAPKTRKPDQMRLLSNLAIMFLAFSARVHDRHGRSGDSNVWSQLEVRQGSRQRAKIMTIGQNSLHKWIHQNCYPPSTESPCFINIIFIKGILISYACFWNSIFIWDF